LQVVQLALDRTELQDKLAQLEQLVKRVVTPGKEMESSTSSDSSEVEMIEAVDAAKEEEDKEKILELLSEIGSDSNLMVARCENFEPWFWDNCDNKVITV
jgi:hypothetical protein